MATTSRGYRKVADSELDKAQAVNDALEDVNTDIGALATQIVEFGQGASSYDISVFVIGRPSSSAVVFAHDVVRAFLLPTNLMGSRASASATAQGACAFSIRKNGIEIGTFSFAAGANVGMVAGEAVAFAVGDLLEILSPALSDTTLINVRLSLKGMAT